MANNAVQPRTTTLQRPASDQCTVARLVVTAVQSRPSPRATRIGMMTKVGDGQQTFVVHATTVVRAGGWRNGGTDEESDGPMGANAGSLSRISLLLVWPVSLSVALPAWKNSSGLPQNF